MLSGCDLPAHVQHHHVPGQRIPQGMRLTQWLPSGLTVCLGDSQVVSPQVKVQAPQEMHMLTWWMGPWRGDI